MTLGTRVTVVTTLLVAAVLAGSGYAALGEVMRGNNAPIHALALTTETPQEYRSKTDANRSRT